MEKTIAPIALVLLCIIAMAASAPRVEAVAPAAPGPASEPAPGPASGPAPASAPAPARAGLDQVQASLIIADGVNIGLGAGLSRHLRLAVNLDLGRQVKSAGTSLLLVYPKQFAVLTGIYGGVGLTYEFSPGAACLHLVGGGEFGRWFAEYEWMIPPRNYGKLRSGLRFRF